MRDFMYVMKVTCGRICACAAFAATVYNPWWSVSTWLGPQLTDTATLTDVWPVKLFVVLCILALYFGAAMTIYKSLGFVWTGFTLSLTCALGLLPFHMGWIDITPLNGIYFLYFYVVPVLMGIAFSAGYITRYMKGTLLVQTVPDHHN